MSDLDELDFSELEEVSSALPVAPRYTRGPVHQSGRQTSPQLPLPIQKPIFEPTPSSSQLPDVSDSISTADTDPPPPDVRNAPVLGEGEVNPYNRSVCLAVVSRNDFLVVHELDESVSIPPLLPPPLPALLKPVTPDWLAVHNKSRGFFHGMVIAIVIVGALVGLTVAIMRTLAQHNEMQRHIDEYNYRQQHMGD